MDENPDAELGKERFSTFPQRLLLRLQTYKPGTSTAGVWAQICGKLAAVVRGPISRHPATVAPKATETRYGALDDFLPSTVLWKTLESGETAPGRPPQSVEGGMMVAYSAPRATARGLDCQEADIR